MTKIGREVTDLVLEFHRALRGLYPHFVRVGLTVGSDEWQEICGNLLAVLVLSSAQEMPAEELSFSTESYALWDPLGSWPAALLVAPLPQGHLLVSDVVPSSRDPGMVVSYRDARPDEIDGMIRLREFANPVRDEFDPTVLDHACGYATAKGGGLVRAAVPVSEGRFYLANGESVQR